MRYAHRFFFSDPGGIRTHGPQLRRLLLYPTELPDPLKIFVRVYSTNMILQLEVVEQFERNLTIQKKETSSLNLCRGSRIRTCDPLLPKQVR